MNHIGLFEGIGGFSIAAKLMGWTTIAWCEIDKFCQQNLRHNFPNAKGHDDINNTDFTVYRGVCDILTGGFPCQPFSLAGQRKGTDDPRHLWPQMLRAVREIRPKWIVGENVYGLLNWDGGVVFEQVCADLENEGYQVQPLILPACGINAPHKRERIFFVAHATGERSGCLQHINRDERDEPYRRGWAGMGEQLGHDGRDETTPHATGARVEGMRSGREDTICGFGDVADPHGENSETRRTGKGIESKGRENNGKQVERGHEAQRADRRADVHGLAPDPDDQGKGRVPNKGEKAGTRQGDELPRIEHRIPDWGRFPTQQPIRGGDDGLPRGLVREYIVDHSGGLLDENEIDRIVQKTLNKYHEKTIHALGNAVVPPLVLQIYKAIEKTEEKLNRYPNL